ncbi:MAG: (d)CMP kinase [Coriobacteriia bacterium]|nr:(d)CMP kinase [Coriobacteriia bacterium]
MIIAIDGPAGSGKSTIAKLLAKRMGFSYLDTGAMYRAVAYRALEEDIDLSEPLSENSKAQLFAIAENEEIGFGFVDKEALPSKVFINQQDVTVQIRTPQVDHAVSPVSAEASVRQALTEQQRRIGSSTDIVMEGRDIGTVVFPDADLKIFLTASPEERAQRRTIQNAASAGKSYDESEYEAILADIIRRDEYDATRQTAPLIAAADSIEVDTTDLSIDQALSLIVQIAEERSISR